MDNGPKAVTQYLSRWITCAQCDMAKAVIAFNGLYLCGSCALRHVKEANAQPTRSQS